MNLFRFNPPVWVLWLLVVGVGLFVPLMDNDSAHHANIALRMYLTGDYVRLVDYDGPYLDKPHLHFWLSALSYHLFGVNSFAYKFPSFVLCLVGVWAVYRASFLLLNEVAAKMAALVFATSASFLLGLNDVRMDAILTAAVAITIWQMAGFIKNQSWRYVLGVALGLAIGFSTKGYIGVLIPSMFFLLYCIFERRWNLVIDYRWLVGVFLFFLFISPVLYAYYIQYNLHPELVVRGRDHINGVRFILWDQTIGRYGGEMGADAKADRLFFFHTFLWVFAPWSILGFRSLIKKGGFRHLSSLVKSILLVMILFGVLIGFSSFKLPHYINITVPLASIWVASILSEPGLLIKKIAWVEWLMWVLIGLVAGLLLIWWFPAQPFWFWLGLLFSFVILFYNIKKLELSPPALVVRISTAVLVLFWLLNAGFYKNLLDYQGGNRLADKLKGAGEMGAVYSLSGCYSSSFYFNTKTIRMELGVEEAKKTTGYLLYDIKQEPELIKAGVLLSDKISVWDYEITKLTGKFLDPDKRSSVCTRLVVAKIN